MIKLMELPCGAKDGFRAVMELFLRMLTEDSSKSMETFPSFSCLIIAQYFFSSPAHFRSSTLVRGCPETEKLPCKDTIVSAAAICTDGKSVFLRHEMRASVASSLKMLIFLGSACKIQYGNNRKNICFHSFTFK